MYTNKRKISSQGEEVYLLSGDANTNLTGYSHGFSFGAAESGVVCVLEVTRAPGPISNALLKAYMKYIVPTMARVLTRDPETVRIWRYYWDTIEACVAPEVVLQALRNAGFVDVRRHVEVGIFSEYQATKP